MRYVGNEYDDFDEDDVQDEDDDFEDEQDDDDGGGSPPARVNPFNTGSSGYGSSQQRTSSLPGANRPGVTSPPGSSPLTSRTSPPPASGRPGAPGQSTLSPPPRPGAGTTPGSTSPATPRYGGTTPTSGSNPASGSTPYGGNRFTPGSSSASSPSGTSPARPTTPASTSSAFGAKPATPAGAKPTEEKKSGGLGGLFGRGGDDKAKDQKSAAKPADSGRSNPLSSLGGLTSRFTGGGKDAGAKPASPAKPAGEKSGGLFGRFTGGGKADDKKPGATTSTGSFNRAGTSPTSSAASSASSAVKRPFGALGGSSAPNNNPATPKGAKAQSGTGGLSRFLPFLGGAKDAGASRQVDKKARASKAPKIEGSGLSLDNKLDILGVALVLASLALFFSRISTNKGQLTEWANNLLTQTFGWGAIAVPMAMMAVGVWLIARHFGDEAPVVPPGRIVGIVIGYVGLLIFMQFVDSFSYSNANGTAVSLNELEKVWLPLAVVRGSGGGWLGSNLYFLLASNLTEYGAFLGAIFLLIVGIMFLLNLSAAELTMIAISVVRSFNDARQRRVQRRAQANALSLEQLTTQAATATPMPVTVTKPQPEALPPAPLAPALPAATAEAALPAGELAAERNISINIGGRREPVPRGDMLPVGNAAGRNLAQPAAKTMDKGLAPAPAGGSFTSRLRSAIPALPGTKSAADKPGVINPEGGEEAVAQTAEKSGTGFRGLFNRQSTTSAASAEANAAPAVKPENGEKSGGFRGMFNRNAAKPAVETPAATAQTAAPSTPATSKPAVVSPAASAVTSPTPALNGKPATGPQIPSSPQEEPRRLGDMLKPATASASASTPAFGERKSPLSPATPVTSPASRPFGADKTSTPQTSPVSSTVAATADKRATNDFSAAPSLRSPVSDSIKPPASGLKPPEKSPLSPPAKSPFGAPLKPSAIFDDEDDIDDELDDEFDDMLDEDDEPDTENVAELTPAKPRGTGPLPRPEDNRSRFSPTTFGTGSSKPNGADQTGSAERLDRLNAIRSGGVGTGLLKPETEKTDKPEVAKPAAAAASVEKQAPVTGRPASNSTPVTSPVSTAPLHTEPARPTAPVSSVAATASAAPAAATSKDSGGDKRPQPAPNFWKPGGEPPRPAGAPPSPELPKPENKPAATSFGKPDMPPGVTMNIPLTSSAPTASASTPTINTPPPPSAELPIRGPGVGTSAPAGVRRHKEWKLPAYSSLLMPGSEGDIDRESLLRRARIIEDTLNSFGAPGKVVEVNTGPVITQFGVEPDYLVTRSGKKNRVKVSAIAQLDKDIQLALGAKSIRIEAPVPGKGYVGLEVPNDVASLVGLRDVMESDNFKKIKSPLAIALGQSVDGTPIAADLTTMPHLLVAGTTGSGKSVCVNAIISSLILCNPPDRVKFIMVDPKRVELTGYNGIPHLVAPVVVDLERIVGVLKWVTREMDERYKKFSNAGARNIEDFNKHLNESDPMPYIVVIIDELADLMMLAPDETERVITRIAALARATGIHLVIATQRPSVDVVTGLIKANFPARIAFAVAGGVDSRVILDQPGAERLLGRGDMLYMSGDSPAPLRLQGVYVSDTEINNITRYWKAQVSDDDQPARPISALVLDNTVAEPSRSVLPNNERQQIQQAFWEQGEKSSVSTGLGSDNDDVSDDQEDELYEQAVEMVRRLDKASVSLLQRRLRIGYTRAARLIDRMEEEGIVGPAVEGSKPREVLPPR